jgi:hypothetical protein
MHEYEHEHEDAQLSGLLRQWQAPEPSAEVEGRVMKACGRRSGAWRFLFTGYVRVPVAVVYVFGVLVSVGVWKLAAHGPVAPCVAEVRPHAAALAPSSRCGHGVPGIC